MELNSLLRGGLKSGAVPRRERLNCGPRIAGFNSPNGDSCPNHGSFAMDRVKLGLRTQTSVTVTAICGEDGAKCHTSRDSAGQIKGREAISSRLVETQPNPNRTIKGEAPADLSCPSHQSHGASG